ncbi:MAG: DUF2851 family protein [Chloroflexota bacterium]
METTTGNVRERRPLESQVARWWREGTFRRVVTTQGRALQVLYPGRPSPGVGPDFLDALLITEEGEFVRGDVEVHIRQRDWQGHGHHRDSRYNHVVLHLFLKNGRNGTWREEGSQVQEVFLNTPLHTPAPLKSLPLASARLSTPLHTAIPLKSPPHTSIPQESPPEPHPTGRRTIAGPIEGIRALPRKELERALDEAGERRFLGKASAMLERLRRGDAQEELFAGLMEALGYSRNRDTMLLLARGLPFGQLKRTIGPKPDRLALEALLLGAAGLLPHQRGLCLPGWEERRRSGDLTEIWRSMGEPLMVATDMWSRSGLRPQNHPVRRLAGASYLIRKYWHSGLVEGLRATLEKRTPREMEKGLEVESTEFWAHHLDFHRPVARAPAMVGRNRAREMVINVLLPFFFARAHLLGDGEMGRRARDLYRSFSPGQDNEITREMKKLLLTSKVSQSVVNSARRQQGLIHMYHVLQRRAK